MAPPSASLYKVMADVQSPEYPPRLGPIPDAHARTKEFTAPVAGHCKDPRVLQQCKRDLREKSPGGFLNWTYLEPFPRAGECIQEDLRRCVREAVSHKAAKYERSLEPSFGKKTQAVAKSVLSASRSALVM